MTDDNILIEEIGREQVRLFAADIEAIQKKQLELADEMEAISKQQLELQAEIENLLKKQEGENDN